MSDYHVFCAAQAPGCEKECPVRAIVKRINHLMPAGETGDEAALREMGELCDKLVTIRPDAVLEGEQKYMC